MKKLFTVPVFLVVALLVAACAPMTPAAPAAPAAEATAAATAEMTTEATTEAAAEATAEAAATEAAAELKDIVDTAVGAGSFGTLVAAVQAAGLVETLKGEGPFTVFAPTEEAFAALPAGTLEQLLADPKGQLAQILLYHVVPGKVMAADVKDGMSAATAQGSPVTFTVSSDGGVMINDAKVVATDIAATNGVIHVIDKVILPPADAAAEASAAAPAPAASAAVTATIPEVAAAAGSFKTLLAAVEAAGLAGELSGAGPFTVFAPTDEAFAKLPAGTVDTLLQDPKGQLTQILLYHVVSGKVLAADVKDGMEAETLQGAPLKFTVGADGSVKIGDASVVGADVAAGNGVIHVIDTVLLPPSQ